MTRHFLEAARLYDRYRHAEDVKNWQGMENLAEISRVLYAPDILSLALIHYELAWGFTFGYLSEYTHDIVRRHIERTDGAEPLLTLLEKVERR